ncbi:RNA-binding protein 34, partial [Morus notabilis]|uniref:RNA-binding protein 34 n=1 Tax=Morus notabilis TaxID=981085 RepID=UPI000CED3375
REAAPTNIDAPRRLLQFAVRDAVAMSRPTITATEPSLKRLRSVVSTTTSDSSSIDRPRRLQSVARVPNPMATMIKAVAEAAEDVTRGTVEDVIYGDDNQLLKQKRSMYLQRSDSSGHYVGNMAMLENVTGLASDSTSENEGYDDVNVLGHSVRDVSQPGTSGGNHGDNEMMVEYSVAKNNDDATHFMRNKDQGQPAVASNASQKIVNISVNVNTWKPPHYKEPREVSEVDGWKSVQEGERGASKSGSRIMKDNSNHVTVNGNAKAAVDSQKESQKTVSPTTGYVAGRPLEDADSRTLFVNNVHFAATKDSLSRHFNKFGEVLKVIIVTDAATGQPTGSAYVEFMRREAADNALSLDGTSFMSRLLKVVRRSAAQQEAAPAMTWPRRATPFPTARFSRAPFPRGMPGSYRPRPIIKPGGARSFQWKRDAQPSPSESGAPPSGNVVPSPTSRSLTYIRTEPKPEANPGTT